MSDDRDALFAFLRTYNHNLRNPMNTIQGTLDLFTMGAYGDLTDKQQRALGRVQRNSKRLLALVEDATRYTRTQQGTFSPEAAPVDVGDLLAAVVADLPPPDEITVMQTINTDDALTLPGEVLREAARHLLCNALAAAPAGGAVTLTASRADGKLVLRVENPLAQPIPADAVPGLTAPFVVGPQPHKRDLPTSGYGLGLAVVAGMCEAASGDLTLAADATTFTATITLPL